MQGNDVFPIPGTKRLKYLEENAGAVQIELSKQELQEVADAVPEHLVEGQRYNPQGLAASYAHYKREQ